MNSIYNYEVNVTYCLLEAPSTEAVDMNHAKLNCRCDWITEVSYDLLFRYHVQHECVDISHKLQRKV